MKEPGNGVKVAKKKGKKGTESSGTPASTSSSQLLHPMSVTIPVGNREVGITSFDLNSLFCSTCAF